MTSRSDALTYPLLVASNLIPVAGMAFWDWRPSQVLLMFWLECLVVTGYGALRILCADLRRDTEYTRNAWMEKPVMLATFFAVYLFYFWGTGRALAILYPPAGAGRGEVTAMAAEALRDQGILAGIAVLLLFHGWVFVREFLLGGEYRRPSREAIVFGPARYLLLANLWGVALCFALVAMNQKAAPLVVFILAKTFTDLHFQTWDHLGRRRSAG